MSTIVLRSVKGAALTSTEIDTNFGNLNVDKVETTAPVFSGTVTLPSQSIALTDSNLPDVAPSLNLDFANSKQLDSRITFGRGSGGAYYDGKTTAKAEQNLLTYSQDFSNGAIWSQGTAPSINNATTAPDGTVTAASVIPTTTVNYHFIANTLTSSGGTSTHSCYVKANGYTKVALRESAATGYYATFNLTTATVLDQTATYVTNPSITLIGNGWYRISATILSSVSHGFSIVCVPNTYTTGNPVIAWTPDGVSGIYIWGAQLEQRSSVTAYTPTTTAPITNYIPVLLQAPLNTPRFDHDSRPTFNGTCTVSGSSVTLPTTFADGSSPSTINKFYTGSINISGTAYVITNYVGSTRVVTVTGSPTAGAFSLVNKNYGQSLGLLIEESRENKLKYSSDFSNAIWALTAASIVNNTTISPDGTKNAGLLIASTATGNHFAYNGTFPTASATSYTFSIYVKKAGYSTCLLNLYDQGGGASVGSAFFNVSTGVVLSSIASSASITPVGNDWYRCTITGPALSGALIPYIYLTNGTNYPSTGDGYSGIYIWGAQLEAGSFATSYIPTPSSSTVTRQPDSASMTGTNFSSWYNQSEGTMYAEAESDKKTSIARGLFSIQDSSINAVNTIGIYFDGNNVNTTFFVNKSSTSILSGLSQLTKGDKEAISYGKIPTIASNGLTASSYANSLGTPILDRIFIGNLAWYGTGMLNGHIRKLSYYPKALSAPQLQGLTK